MKLLLNNKCIKIPTSNKLKITRNNQYITDAGDYTLEINIPLSILENREFFGAVNRIESKKELLPYKAVLIVAGMTFSGSANITHISNEEVKMQLVGEQSEFNAVFGDYYIDEINLPKFFSNDNAGFGGSRNKIPPTKGPDGYAKNINSGTLTKDMSSPSTFIYAPIYNETAGKVINLYSAVAMRDGTKKAYHNKQSEIPQYNLLYVINCVFHSLGYAADLSRYDIEPYNRIYIANVIDMYDITGALPHWKLREFLKHIKNFFGCSFVFSSERMEVKMVPAMSNEAARIINLNTEDVFNMEVSENDIESEYTSTLHYDLSESDYHDIDIISEDKLKTLPVKEFKSSAEMISFYSHLNEFEKAKYLYICPDGYFCQWKFVNGKDENFNMLIRINHFQDLSRNNEDDDNSNILDLKIVPVAMADDIAVPLFYETDKTMHGSTQHIIEQTKDSVCYQQMPTVIGNEEYIERGEKFGQGGYIYTSTVTVQDLIEGDATINKYVKQDRLEVFLWDGREQVATEYKYGGRRLDVGGPAPFTDYELKDMIDMNHKEWSLSLQPNSTITTMFNCHNHGSIDMRRRYNVNFLSRVVPSAQDIYVINNRKFIAESIDINIKDGAVDNLMNGVFIEYE